MSLARTIIFLAVTSILLIACEETLDQQENPPDEIVPVDTVSEDSIPNPLIGTWEYQNGRTELYMISEISQYAINYSQEIDGSVQISGSQDITFRHFTSDLLFWSGVPNYLLTNDYPWIFPRKELRLFDTSGTKSAVISMNSEQYYSNSIDWEYSKITGNLHIPRTKLFTDNHLDSITVIGDATVPMLLLEAGIPSLAFYLDTIRAIEPLQSIEFLQSDSLLAWADTPDDTVKVGRWYAVNDSLSIIISDDSTKYFYSIQGDTLTFISPKMFEDGFDLYEVYADLEPNSIQAVWDLLQKKYIRIHYCPI